jgi:hypothetical protein
MELDEIFIEYDGPRLFTARSMTDQLFLAEWAARLEDGDLWLYVPVSKLRLEAVKSGNLTVRQAYTQPEGFLYSVFLNNDLEVPDIVQVLSSKRLEESWLPEKDFRLEIPVATRPAAVSLDELSRKSMQEGRSRFRLEIDSPHKFRSEASTRRVASLLNSVQNVFDNFGLVLLDADPAQDGRFAKSVQDRMETDIVELAAASFVIELGAVDGDDLFGDSPIAMASERLVKLLAVDIDQQVLLDELYDLKPRAAKSFRSFVGELASLGSNVVVTSASTARRVSTQSLTADEVDDLRRLLKQILPAEVREVRGRMTLFAGDFEKREFGLRDLFDHESYEGRIGERAVAQVEHAVLMDVYDVVLSEYSSLETAIGETKVKYVLEQLSRANETQPIPPTFSVISSLSSLDALW